MFGKENAEEKHIFSKSFKKNFWKKEIDMMHIFWDLYGTVWLSCTYVKPSLVKMEGSPDFV
jgi:hypothetical protein